MSSTAMKRTLSGRSAAAAGRAQPRSRTQRKTRTSLIVDPHADRKDQRLPLPDPHVQAGDRGEAAGVAALYPDEVMARLVVAVHRPCVAVLGQRHHVTVTVRLDLGAAVAEVPRFLAVRRAEGPDEERHRVARAELERRGVG